MCGCRRFRQKDKKEKLPCRSDETISASDRQGSFFQFMLYRKGMQGVCFFLIQGPYALQTGNADRLSFLFPGHKSDNAAVRRKVDHESSVPDLERPASFEAAGRCLVLFPAALFERVDEIQQFGDGGAQRV